MAPEVPVFTFLKKRNKHITTGDFNPTRYKHLDKKIKFVDILNIPFPNETFDLIIANHILEHIPDDAKAMSEIYRVLKHGGEAILQVPFSQTNDTTIEEPDIQDPIKQSELFGQFDHVRIYTKETYADRLNKAGFLVNILSQNFIKNHRELLLQDN